MLTRLGANFVALVALILLPGLVTAQSSTTGVGDYIAQGLGASNTSTPAPSTLPASSAYTTIKSVEGTTRATSTTLSSPGAGLPTPSPTVSGTASLGGSPSNASVDECFSSWERWLSASRVETHGTTSPISTYTSSNIYTDTAFKGYTTSYVVTISTVETIVNAGFTIATESINTVQTSTYTISDQPATTSSAVYTETVTTVLFPNNTLSKPSCSLPQSVSQCQSQWNAFVTTQLVPAPTLPADCPAVAGGWSMYGSTYPPCAESYFTVAEEYYTTVGLATKPVCTQASIGGSLCNSIRDDYPTGDKTAFAPTFATTAYLPFVSAGYYGGFKNISGGDFNITWTWPTSSTLGVPSCTVGCGRCAVTGGTVQLIYWPQATATATGNNTAAKTALVTVETLGTTFTSPTLYISYSNVYAANACSNVGTTISNTIVAIPTDKPLSSVYGGTIPCDAHFRYTQEWTATAPFNVTDLYQTPVPYSIYSSQPWCATAARCLDSCPTTLPYRPILVVAEPILQGMDAAWATCYGDIRGVYDPPIALQPATSVAGPQIITTNTVQTQSATPASGLVPNTPTPTSQPTASTTATAEPDDVGSTIQSISGLSATSQTSVQDPTPTATQQDGETTTPGSANPSPSTQHSSPTVPPSGVSTTTEGSSGPTSQDVAGVLASLLASSEQSQSSTQAESPTTKPTPNKSGVDSTSQNTGDAVSASTRSGSGQPSQSLTAVTSVAADPAQTTSGTQKTTIPVTASGVAVVATTTAVGITLQNSETTVTLSAGGTPVSLGSQSLSEAADGTIVTQSGTKITTTQVGMNSATSTDVPSSVSVFTGSASSVTLSAGLLGLAFVLAVLVL